MEGVVKRSFWQDRSIFVTGATGLLGGWLVPALTMAGARVVCLVRDWVPESTLIRDGMLSGAVTVRGDVTDQALVERVLGEYEVETVFHLAAQTIVSIANRNPTATFDSNIRGSWSVLEACRRSPTVAQVVVASSDKAYGEQPALPYDEEMPLRPHHPYDATKACADLLAQTYAATYRLPVAITRCGNFYGGGDLNWNRIVPGTIRSVLRRAPILIRSDGEYVRDYFYVEDGAAAYLLLAEKLAQNPNLSGRAFNFSNELQISVIELVRYILRLMHSTAEPEILGEATNEIRHQYLSAERARKELGWRPLFTLEEGLKRTIEWYRRFLGAPHTTTKSGSSCL